MLQGSLLKERFRVMRDEKSVCVMITEQHDTMSDDGRV